MTVKITAASAAFVLAAGLGTAALSQPPAEAPKAEAAAPAAKAKFSVSGTPLVTLMRNPQTKPILAKHMSGIFDQVEANIDQIPEEFTLETLMDYAQGMITPENLKAIDADLAKL